MLARLALGRDDKLVEEEFTLTFLSLPKDAAFIVPTLTNALRRLEWALASGGQPGRAERVAHLMQRIERLQLNADRITSTQIMRAPNEAARATGTLSAARNGSAQPKRQTNTQLPASPNAQTRQLGGSHAYDPDDA